jgi:hypothetical protein
VHHLHKKYSNFVNKNDTMYTLKMLSVFQKKVREGLKIMQTCSLPQIAAHAIFFILILFSVWWAQSGFVSEEASSLSQVVLSEKRSVATTTTQQKDKVRSNDDAVEAYLHAAQIQAEIYAFTNNASYDGLCEPSVELNSLSGGILKYIKSVGATEVFCANTNSVYMIEAQLPERRNFFCIDSRGTALEQKNSREGEVLCSD